MRERFKCYFFFPLLFCSGIMIVFLLGSLSYAEEKRPSEVKIPPKILPQDALITMDFQDVDLTVVIKFIGELTGKNFVLGDQVRGKVTIISPQKITVREAYKVFESVLEMNGYTAVEREEVIKIIPSGMARQTGMEIREGREAKDVKLEDRMVTQIIPLSHASSDEVRNIFTPLISKDGMIISYRPTNHLILTERSSNIHRLLRIIEQIDIPLGGEKITVFSLEFASAKSLAEKFNQLVLPDPRAAGAARPGGAPVPQRIIKVIPDERTNSLVVLANETDLQEIRQLVKQLDGEAPKGKSQLHVRYLEHARAEELAKVLSAIVGAKAKVPQRTQTAQTGTAEEASITADKATNSLVITASPQEFRELEEVIQKLDMIRSQVLVEALIAEVSMEKALQIGVEWRIIDQPVEGSTRGYGGTDFGIISGVQTGTLSDVGLALGVVRGSITVGGVQVPNIGALVRAFQKDTDVNVLSTPHLLTMDNEKAKIIVAENVPILKTDLTTPLATATATTSSVAVSRTFEYKDIGIQLEITPHISKGSMVRLEIAAEVSNITSVDPTNPGFVTTRKRQANTTVVIENSQMVVIGGLIRNDQLDETKKVPCLGNIPIIGWLFKTSSGSTNKTNLLIFITPHIVRSPEDLEKATAMKKKEADENTKKLKKEREKEVQDTLEMLMK